MVTPVVVNFAKDFPIINLGKRREGELGHIECLGHIQRYGAGQKTEWYINQNFKEYLKETGKLIPEATFFPALLSDEIQLERIKAYGKIDPTDPIIPQSTFNTAVQYTADHFRPCWNAQILAPDESWMACDEDPTEENYRILSTHLAYNSIDHIMSSHSKSRKKSPGFPWNTPKNPTGHVHSTKESLFEDPKFADYLVEYIFQMLIDEPYWCFMSSCLKDEIVKEAKIKEKKTRLFMAMGAEHMCASVAVFGLLHDELMKKSDQTWCTAGQDYHYGHHHRKISLKPWATWMGIDFNNYDVMIRRLYWVLLYLVFRKWFRGEVGGTNKWKVIRYLVENVLKQALYGIFIDSEGYVYIKFTGNPSGQFLTLLLNTLLLYAINVMAWIDRVPSLETEMRGTFSITPARVDFEYYLRNDLCGDDQRHNIHDDILPFWTPAMLTEYWEDVLGFSVKQPFQYSKDVREIEYCGKTSIVLYGRYVPVPRINKFISSIYFTVSDTPRLEIIRLRSLYMELYTRPDLQEALMDYVLWFYRKLGGGMLSDLLDGIQTFPTEKEQRHLWLGF